MKHWIIARYNEDLSWIHPYLHLFNKVFIYNKGNDVTIDASNVVITNLPNVGREAHTYIHHIIENYNNLGIENVFTQGSVFDKISKESFEELINNGTAPKLITLDMEWQETIDQHFGQQKPYGKGLSFTAYGPMLNTGLTLQQYCEKYFCPVTTEKNKTQICLYGIFSISKYQILSYSKKQYEYLIDNSGLSKHINPEDAYYMERLWYYVYKSLSFLNVLYHYSSLNNVEGSDKVTIHSYGEIYDKLITPLRSKKEIRVLEIGIMSGAFLQALSEYLPNAEIHGLDITLSNVKHGKNNPKIILHSLDGTKESSATSLNLTFDIIIEDGSHLPEHQKLTLKHFGAYLKPNGVYVVEDINGAYIETLQKELEDIGKGHSLLMEWIDLRHVKNRYDDILAVFKK